MRLLSNLAAHDLGYLSGGQLLDRSAQTLESMEQLERYRGHFYNWYDTCTGKPLQPLYVSSVDSGNLTGHLRVLRSGLLELPHAAALPGEARNGLRDTFGLLVEQLRPDPVGRSRKTDDPSRMCDLRAMESVKRLLQHEADGLAATAAWLRDLSTAATRLAGSIDAPQHREAAWWAHAFDRQARGFLDDLTQLAPWLRLPAESLDPDGERLLADMDHVASIEELGRLAQQAAEVLAAGPAGNGRECLVDALLAGSQRICSRIRQLEDLAERCMGLADADFSFLYVKSRKLLSIGYWVTDRRLDNGFYDLLASEARLASYAAIASGQLPFDHWFALGRRLTTVRGTQTLLSWSGSMFEYLMPLLVMPDFQDTLLDQTCRAAVTRQIDYGRRAGCPGVSQNRATT